MKSSESAPEGEFQDTSSRSDSQIVNKPGFWNCSFHEGSGVSLNFSSTDRVTTAIGPAFENTPPPLIQDRFTWPRPRLGVETGSASDQQW